MLLLLNGQRIFQYSRGVVEWNNLPIPLENIERIEVVRGPAAAAYGSNALQAVINIQTGSAAEYPGLSTRVAGGSEGIADGFVRYGGRVGAMDYTLSVSSVGDHGYPGVYDKPAQHQPVVPGRSAVRRRRRIETASRVRPGRVRDSRSRTDFSGAGARFPGHRLVPEPAMAATRNRQR
jgi:outer membrane cobalamin receptor